VCELAPLNAFRRSLGGCFETGDGRGDTAGAGAGVGGSHGG